MIRTVPLVNNEIYHVMNKSIAGYQIFNTEKDYQRMLQLMRFFQYSDAPMKFSRFLEHTRTNKLSFETAVLNMYNDEQKQVDIVAYCLMPTHIHVILRQVKANGIAIFMSNVTNGYARYFNISHSRQGHLWMGRFKNVLLQTDEQLIHTIRYLHINPTTAKLVQKPNQWVYSSHNEYVAPASIKQPICSYEDLSDMDPQQWDNFTASQISYQQELAEMKKTWLE